jgi:hypothetical protein
VVAVAAGATKIADVPVVTIANPGGKTESKTACGSGVPTRSARVGWWMRAVDFNKKGTSRTKHCLRSELCLFDFRWTSR